MPLTSRTPSAPRSARLRRPTWRDPRLAGGAVLIAASLALGAWAVDSASHTDQVYLLTRDVAPGTSLEEEGLLTLVDANPGTDVYVEAGSLPSGAVTTRSLSAGELVPEDAVGEAALGGMRSLVLEVATALPAGTAVGDVVDLWALPPAQSAVSAAAAEASVVAEGLTISAVGESGTSLVGSTTTSVEVLVPDDSVGAVLTAVGGQGALVLVPTGQGA